jgi:hypothetical protein
MEVKSNMKKIQELAKTGNKLKKKTITNGTGAQKDVTLGFSVLASLLSCLIPYHKTITKFTTRQQRDTQGCYCKNTTPNATQLHGD